jgi:hypothetical protein
VTFAAEAGLGSWFLFACKSQLIYNYTGIYHKEIGSGGELALEMSTEPNL